VCCVTFNNSSYKALISLILNLEEIPLLSVAGIKLNWSLIMKKASCLINKQYKLVEIDKRMYGSFIEHM